jgi:hypothetical protein
VQIKGREDEMWINVIGIVWSYVFRWWEIFYTMSQKRWRVVYGIPSLGFVL